MKTPRHGHWLAAGLTALTLAACDNISPLASGGPAPAPTQSPSPTPGQGPSPTPGQSPTPGSTPTPTPTPTPPPPAAAAARYRVTFDATWSQETHPQQFPPGPHFSALIGATHTSALTIWEEGRAASAGIRNMAQTGTNSPLDLEINSAVAAGLAETLLAGSAIFPAPGRISLEFNVSLAHARVSLVAMIAPSPDWFIGVSSLSLLDDDLQWLPSLDIGLGAWDAGTDSGATFLSADLPTTPAQPIAQIDSAPLAVNGTVAPLGRFVFQRLQ